MIYLKSFTHNISGLNKILMMEEPYSQDVKMIIKLLGERDMIYLKSFTNNIFSQNKILKDGM